MDRKLEMMVGEGGGGRGEDGILHTRELLNRTLIRAKGWMTARRGRRLGGEKEEESILTKALLNCSLNALLVVCPLLICPAHLCCYRSMQSCYLQCSSQHPSIHPSIRLGKAQSL
ncbi:unnamed protein product [Onchocerca flexuosa]|uniref:Uncharacterized protein n=1 Tax=Onchocerca flexuosa TaxID=387005 RepID=A0A183GYZ1_9BILA|nr:unnamed protein product [Onchocerca flexuosa]